MCMYGCCVVSIVDVKRETYTQLNFKQTSSSGLSSLRTGNSVRYTRVDYG